MKPHQRTTIWTLLAAGSSQREIERVTRIDRKTIRAYQKRFAAELPATSPGVATGPTRVSAAVTAALAGQFPPPRPPTAAVTVTVSACEPWRQFIEGELRLRRNAMSIYQDLVDQYGFTGCLLYTSPSPRD